MWYAGDGNSMVSDERCSVLLLLHTMFAMMNVNKPKHLISLFIQLRVVKVGLLMLLSLKVLSIHFSLLDYSQRSRQLLKCVKLEERSEARITNRKYISFDDDARRSLVGLLDVDVSPVRVYLYAVYVVLT